MEIRTGKAFANAAEAYATKRVIIRGGGLLRNSLLRYCAHNVATLAAGIIAAAFGNVLEGTGIVALGLLVSAVGLTGKGLKSSQRKEAAARAFAQIDPTAEEDVSRAAVAMHNMSRVPRSRPAAQALESAMGKMADPTLITQFDKARQQISISAGNAEEQAFFEAGGDPSAYVMPPSEFWKE